MDTHAVLTTAQLAARWQLPQTSVCKLAREGSIPAMRLGKHWRFSLTAIERWEAGVDEPAAAA